MTTDKTDPSSWGADDRAIVAEMLRDRQSEHWVRCNQFVEKLVQRGAKNIPQDVWSDIVQEVMARVERKLPEFAYRSTLKTWLITITHHCIIDEVRRRQRDDEYIFHPREPTASDDGDTPNDPFTFYKSRSLEDTFDIQERLREAMTALVEHLASRENPRRDERVIELVIFQGRSRKEAAEAVGISVAMVGYIVRTAQQYVREKVGYRLRNS